MDPELYRRAQALFEELCDLTREQRSQQLEQVCGGDPDLRNAVQRLLDHDAAEDSFLDATRPDDATVPAEIPGFTILGRIGEGGMGVVFLAEQHAPRRRVALKILRLEAAGPSTLGRFRREARLLALLQHPGIAQIFATGALQNGRVEQPFFAMEFVDGMSLTEFARAQRLDDRARLELVAAICDAIEHAHKRGVIHRDLKPDNVLVTRSESGEALPKVLDFGIAHAVDTGPGTMSFQTMPGQIVGTLTYMSPEQVETHSTAVDARADVYALGAILFELLTGSPPIDVSDATVLGAVQRIRDVEPTRVGTLRPELRGDVEIIVARALEKDRSRRYASAADLAADIRSYLRLEPIRARPASALYQLHRFARRHKGLVIGLAAAGCAMFVGAIVATVLAIRANDAATEADDRSYLTSLTAVALALGQHDPMSARRVLDQAPDHLRDWEWHYLSAQTDATVSEFAIVAPSRPPDRWGTALPGVAFDAQGHALGAYVQRDELVVVDVRSGEIRMRTPAPVDLSRIQLSHDGRRVAGVSEQTRRAYVWNAPDGALLMQVDVGVMDPEQNPIQLSPDGSLAALQLTSDSDSHRRHGASVVDVETGRESCRVGAYDDPDASHAANDLVSTLFDESGDRLFLQFRETSKIVDARTGERIASHVRSRLTAIDRGAAWSPDGRHLAGTVDQRAFNVLDDTLRFVATGPFSSRARAVAFTPDSAHVVSTHGDGVRLWKVADWSLPPLTNRTSLLARAGRPPARTIAARHAGSVAVHPAGRLVLVGDVHGFSIIDFDHRATLTLQHDEYVNFVSWSPDGTRIATAEYDRAIKLWNSFDGSLVATFPHGSTAKGLGFSRDGARVATITDDSRIAAWDLATGQVIPDAAPDADVATFIDFYDVVDWSASSRHDGTAGVCIQASFDGRWIVAAGEPSRDSMRELCVWDARTRQPISRIDVYPHGAPASPSEGSHTDQIRAVAISNDNETVATYTHGRLRTWNVRRGTMMSETESGLCYGLAFSHDGRRLACAMADATIELRDAETLAPRFTLRGHDYYVYAVAFSPRGDRLASASGDGTVRIWDAAPARERLRARRGPRVEGRGSTTASEPPPIPAGLALGSLEFLSVEIGSVPARLVRIDASNGAVTEIARLPLGLVERLSLAIVGDETFVLEDSRGAMRLARLDPTTGALHGPVAVTLDGRRIATAKCLTSSGDRLLLGFGMTPGHVSDQCGTVALDGTITNRIDLGSIDADAMATTRDDTRWIVAPSDDGSASSVLYRVQPRAGAPEAVGVLPGREFTALATTRDDRVFALDRGSHRIVELDSLGRILASVAYSKSHELAGLICVDRVEAR